MLVAANALLQHAVANRYAIGAYDILDTTMLEGVLLGAQRAEAPVLISIAEVHTDQFDEAILLAAAVEAATAAPVPVAIHYDHGSTLDRLVRATQLGYTSLMIDGSHLDWGENIALTRRAATLAHAVGLPLEAEIGYVPGEEGKDAEHHPGAIRYTEPDEAEALAHFRSHPDHQRFADSRFRPFAERITIDFRLTEGNGRCATPKSSQR